MSMEEERRYAAPTVLYDSAEQDGKTPPAPPLKAEQLEKVAERFRIPLYEDPGVVEALARLDMSAAIPVEIYGVIADVLGFVYRLDNESS